MKTKSLKTTIAIIIDPIKRSVYQENVPTSLDAWQSALECKTVGVAYQVGTDDLLCDDEGMTSTDYGFFLIERPDAPIFGRGLIVGKGDKNGDATDALSKVDEIRASVHFFSPDRFK